MILVSAGGERFARFAADPHPGLAGAVAGDEDDEMLEAGLGEFSVEFEAGGVVGQAAAGRFAEPGGEAAFLGDGGEGVVGFPGAEGELLAGGLPAEFFDEELGQVHFCRSGRERGKSSGIGQSFRIPREQMILGSRASTSSCGTQRRSSSWSERTSSTSFSTSMPDFISRLRRSRAASVSGVS